jgi:hypothetical protein
MAAAAIASGAVPDPDAGVAAGAPVVGTATASVTATGFGVVMDNGCATTAATFEESALEVVPEDGFSVDLAVPDFAVLDFAWDCWVGSVLALALAPASEVCPVVAPPPAKLSLADWSEPVVLREAVLSVGGELLSDRGWADCCGAADVGCGVGTAGPLPVSAATLLSISAPKRSVACDWSDRADFGGAV